MKWRAAVGRAWKLPVIWDAGTDPQPAIAAPVQATVVYVHYYVPVPDSAGLRIPGEPARDAITEGNQ